MWHKWMRGFKDVFVSKKGSPTVEYVIIIAAGVLLASILLWAINSDEIKTSLETAVKNAIEGKVSTEDNATQTAKENVNTSFNFASENSDNNSVPVNEKKDDRNLLEKGLDYVFGDWSGPGKAWDRVKDDWNKMWDKPGEYWSEFVGWEDIKGTWNQLTSEPGQYIKDSWNRTWNEAEGVWNDPLGTGQQLLEDVIGINDAKAFWNGVDPETDEEISVPDRVIRGVAAVPIIGKPVKLIDKGLDFGKKLFIKPACGRRTGNDSCPGGNHEDNNDGDQDQNRDNNDGNQDRKFWDDPVKLQEKLKKLGIRQPRLDRLLTGKNPRLHANTGKITQNSKGYYEVTLHDGTKKTIPGKKYYGKDREITINGQKYTVHYNENGFPDLKPHSDFETQLPEKYYQIDTNDQFLLLNLEMADRLEKEKNDGKTDLKDKLTDTALDTIQNGIGSGKMGKKYERFFKETNLKNKLNMTDQELKDIAEGRGSKTLYDRINSDPKLKQELVDANTDWLKKGEDPLGYTWHHHQDKGKMQLVKSKIHGKVNHVGGEKIWGGTRDGSSNQEAGEGSSDQEAEEE